MDKAALRRHLRDLRRALPARTRRALNSRLGVHLARAITELSEQGQPIALYAPRGSEASPLLALPLPNPIAWPRVLTFRREAKPTQRRETVPPRLAFHLASFEDLSVGPLGIREPRPTDPEVAAEALLAIVVPLVGFDAQGYRLGQGGGFYDALIASLPAAPRPRLIGLAYACQEVDAVPREPHDRPVDLVITEGGARRPT